ncbi:hypothetical protein D9757_011687 [Collybiopsis confluens]|uniref:Uncharacterized protein n=1 Tax=Collybiopsis confluens TaxID=2823264 RepID=A0A8H5GM44_9AGAR|nr:hypothetical protein D9757_011687 [Collybiopsis confluens]
MASLEKTDVLANPLPASSVVCPLFLHERSYSEHELMPAFTGALHVNDRNGLQALTETARAQKENVLVLLTPVLGMSMAWAKGPQNGLTLLTVASASASRPDRLQEEKDLPVLDELHNTANKMYSVLQRARKAEAQDLAAELYTQKAENDTLREERDRLQMQAQKQQQLLDQLMAIKDRDDGQLEQDIAEGWPNSFLDFNSTRVDEPRAGLFKR